MIQIKKMNENCAKKLRKYKVKCVLSFIILNTRPIYRAAVVYGLV